jgi:hypothetical protein
VSEVPLKREYVVHTCIPAEKRFLWSKPCLAGSAEEALALADPQWKGPWIVKVVSAGELIEVVR